MIIYSGTKKEFMHSVDEDSIAVKIQYTMMVKMGRRPSDNEFRAWNNSLEYMYKVLNDEGIPNDSGVAIEYNIPQTSKRVDFIPK